MLVPLYRLAERVGRVFVKSGLIVGEAAGNASRFLRGGLNGQAAAPAAAKSNGKTPRPAAETATFLHLTLNPRHVPALVLLVVANVALIVVATVLVTRATRPTDVGAGPANAPPVVAPALLPTPLSAQALSTEIAQSVPDLKITISPPPLGPTPTAPPNPLSLGGTIFYAYRNFGRTNLWAQGLGPQARPPVRITAGPWDDRDPAVSPDGTRLAFSSHRDGSWNLYLLDLRTGEVKRLTTGPDFKAHPNWSPDSKWLVFELYQNNNFDIAILNAGGGSITQLTDDPAADYEPVWSPNGREIIWVSMRTGKPELWRRSLDKPNESFSEQLTDAPDIQPSDPAYSPNGQLVAYTDSASQFGLIYTQSATDPGDRAVKAAQGRHPVWSPDGSSLLTVAPQVNGQDYLLATPLGQLSFAQIAYQPASGHLGAMSWSPVTLPAALPGTMAQASAVVDAPLWSEIITATVPGRDPPYALVPLPNVTAPDPHLSDRVDEAFTGLRRTIFQSVGWDFLGTLDSAAIPLTAPPPPSLEYDSWLKTGRAFDIAQAATQAGWVAVTREDVGFNTYWRVWVRAVAQDGSFGEPLRRPPWNFAARYSKRPQPYDAGGEYYNALPPGYFVDFTTLAEDFGWTRVPAQENWHSFFPGILYWRFEHRDGLDWLTALREIYNAQQAATQTPIPSPTSTPTITPTPSDTPTPTNTLTPTRRPTLTPSQTPTRRPTRTPTPTPSRWPTRTFTPTITHWPTRTPTPTPTPSRTRTPTGTWYTATSTPTPTLTETEQVSAP
jgi:TolB protein